MNKKSVYILLLQDILMLDVAGPAEVFTYANRYSEQHGYSGQSDHPYWFVPITSQPNAKPLIVSLRVIGISDFTHHFSHRFSFQF